MGKGDRKTAKGKRYASSHGNARPKGAPAKKAAVKKAAPVAKAATKAAAPKKAPAKKAAAK